MSETQKNNTSREGVSLLGAIAIGIGGMVGGGIFAVLGEAVAQAHSATPIAFLIAGIVALLTAYSYTKLSLAYPSRGGTIVFIDRVFGVNLLSGGISFMLWLSYLVTISLYATAFGSYGITFFSDKSTILSHLLISAAILLPMVINLISSLFVSRMETVVVAIKLSILMLVIVASVSCVDISKLSVSHYSTPFSIIAAGMVIFVAYEGFELIANTSEDIINPKKNLPRAYYYSVGFVILLYILIAIITVGAVPEAELMKAKDYALAVAAKPAMGQLGFTLVALAALLATFSAINATIYGNARLSFDLVHKGELPVLSRKYTGTLKLDIIATAVLSLILANSINLTEIAIIGSASFLLVFSIVNFSAYKKALEIDASKWITITAFLLVSFALMVLMLYTYKSNTRAVMVFLIFVVLSFAFEYFYGKRVRGHFMGRAYTSKENVNEEKKVS